MTLDIPGFQNSCPGNFDVDYKYSRVAGHKTSLAEAKW